MDAAVKFLREYIDDNVFSESWQQEAKEKLPLALAGSFEYRKATLLGETVLFMKPIGAYPVGKMQKWMDIAWGKSGMKTVLVLADASQYTVKKLLMDRTAFMVAGRQISLPFMAMQIQRAKDIGARDIRKFSPGTQLIYLYLLYMDGEEFTQEDVGSALHVSPMTVVRGMNDLVSLGLVLYEMAGRTGRKKVYHRCRKKDYYHNGKPYLDNPVRGLLYVDKMPQGVEFLKSDLTALSERTMLGEPDQIRYAVYSPQRHMLDGHIVTKDRALQEGLPIVQLMKYDVSLLGKDGLVDPITLIWGLAEADERVDMAVDEMMGGVEWYEA